MAIQEESVYEKSCRCHLEREGVSCSASGEMLLSRTRSKYVLNHFPVPAATAIAKGRPVGPSSRLSTLKRVFECDEADVLSLAVNCRDMDGRRAGIVEKDKDRIYALSATEYVEGAEVEDMNGLETPQVYTWLVMLCTRTLRVCLMLHIVCLLDTLTSPSVPLLFAILSSLSTRPACKVPRPCILRLLSEQWLIEKRKLTDFYSNPRLLSIHQTSQQLQLIHEHP